MRRISLAVLMTMTLFILSPGSAQTADSKGEEQLLTLIKEVQAQQAQIADNEAKIDIKLADLAEAIRVARIYSKRGK